MDVGPLLVFSPHLDDAVLSLGNLITAHAGSTVVTVLAGMPQDETLVTEWDMSCGFAGAGETMRARWAEDEAAVAALGASAIHLEFLDRQYGRADPAALSDAVGRLLAEYPDRPAYGPLGVWHPDHRRVSDAFLDAVASHGTGHCHLYADIPHYSKAGSIERRLAELERRGVKVGPLVEGPAATDAKVRSSACYVSQMRGLGGMPLDLPELTAAVGGVSRSCGCGDVAAPPARRSPG